MLTLPFMDSRAWEHRPRVAEMGLLAVLTLALVMTTPTPADADARTDARLHFRRGMALVAEGAFEEGIAELMRAYEVLPHPNVLYNIARVYAEATRYEEAVAYFARYLETDPDDRVEVEAMVMALEERVRRLSAPPLVSETTSVATSPPHPADSVEDAARRLEDLATATQNEALRERVRLLRDVAAQLRERTTATPTTPPADVGTTPPQAVPVPTTNLRQSSTYEDAVVSASRTAESTLEAPNSTAIVTSQDLRLSGLPNQSWVDTLRRVPGVSFMRTDVGNPQLNVRGLNQRLSNRTAVLVDGRTVYLDFIGTTLFELLPVALEDIDRIEVIRGPTSALYGADAFSGVVNIITRPVGEPRTYVSAGIGNGGAFRVQGGVSQRFDRLRIRLSSGYSAMQQYATEASTDRVDRTPLQDDPSVGYRTLSFSAEFSRRFDGGVIASAGTALASGDGLTVQGLSRIRQLATSDMLLAQTYAQIETPWGLSTRIFWNRFRTALGTSTQIPDGIPLAQQADVDRSDVFDAELLLNRRVRFRNIRNHFLAGLTYRLKSVEWPWLASGLETQHHVGAFLQDSITFNAFFRAVASVRADLHPLAGPQASPRVSLLFHPSEAQTLRLTGGAAFRGPTFVESYVNIPNSTPLRAVTAVGVGNENLSPERIVSFELGYMNQSSERMSFEANVYYNVILDTILLTESTNFRLSDSDRTAYNEQWRAYTLSQLNFANQDETFQQFGGEVSLRVFPLQGLDLFSNYAYHETRPLGGPPGALHDDQRTSAHVINAGIQFRSRVGVDLSLDWGWQSRQVWTEQVLDPSRGVAFVGFPLSAYHSLNARVGMRFLGDRLDVSVSGTNLVSAGHREHPFGQPIERRFFGNAALRL